MQCHVALWCSAETVEMGALAQWFHWLWILESLEGWGWLILMVWLVWRSCGCGKGEGVFLRTWRWVETTSFFLCIWWFAKTGVELTDCEAERSFHLHADRRLGICLWTVCSCRETRSSWLPHEVFVEVFCDRSGIWDWTFVHSSTLSKIRIGWNLLVCFGGSQRECLLVRIDAVCHISFLSWKDCLCGLCLEAFTMITEPTLALIAHVINRKKQFGDCLVRGVGGRASLVAKIEGCVFPWRVWDDCLGCDFWQTFQNLPLFFSEVLEVLSCHAVLLWLAVSGLLGHCEFRVSGSLQAMCQARWSLCLSCSFLCHPRVVLWLKSGLGFWAFSRLFSLRFVFWRMCCPGDGGPICANFLSTENVVGPFTVDCLFDGGRIFGSTVVEDAANAQCWAPDGICIGDDHQWRTRGVECGKTPHLSRRENNATNTMTNG